MQEFSTTLSPRFYETDALGHINNSVIAAWFEVARTEFIASLASGDAIPPQAWILAAVSLDFIAETFYGADVTIRFTEVELGNTSIRIACEMSQHGRCTVRGRCVLVHMDPASKRPARVPDSLRARLAE
jgi:acyl-CoA thioester hydrolase